MTVAVAYKWAGDSQEAVVRADGSIDFGRAKAVVSDHDAVAITLGRQIADDLGTELVGLSVGGPEAAATIATKSTLSRGLDRVVVLTDEAYTDAGPTRIGTALAALVETLDDVSLVLTGDSSIDLGTKMVPPVLGGRLGWPTLAEVNGVAVTDTVITVHRDLGSRTEELTLTLPAVLAVTTDAVTVKAPGMKDVMNAARKPVRKVTPAELGLTPTPEGRTVERSRREASERRGIRIDCSDPTRAARELVAALQGLGLIQPRGGETA